MNINEVLRLFDILPLVSGQRAEFSGDDGQVDIVYPDCIPHARAAVESLYAEVERLRAIVESTGRAV